MPILGLQNSVSGSAPYSKFDRWSLDFDGTDDYIDLGDNKSFIAAGNFSIAFWVKLNDGQESGTRYFMGADKGDSTNEFYIGYTSGGKLQFRLEGNNDTATAASDNVIFANGANPWIHIVGTWEIGASTGGDMKFYVNGEHEFTYAMAGITKSNWNAYDPAENFYVGAENIGGTNQGEVGGRMSDLAMYDTVLTAGQITTIYNGRAPYNHKTGVASANLFGWWRMGDGVENATGTTIYDASTNSNNGTMTNMDAADFVEDTPE